MVTVSKKAAEEFKRLFTARELPMTTKVRVIAERVPEQEGGIRVYLEFDTKPTASTDEAQVSEGIELVMEKELAEQLGDIQIDYAQQGAEVGSFVFRRGEGTREQ